MSKTKSEKTQAWTAINERLLDAYRRDQDVYPWCGAQVCQRCGEISCWEISADSPPWPLACPPPMEREYVCRDCVGNMGDVNGEDTAVAVLAILCFQDFRYCEICTERIWGGEGAVVEEMSKQIGRWVCDGCREQLDCRMFIPLIVHSIIRQRAILASPIASSDDQHTQAVLATVSLDAKEFDAIGSLMLAGFKEDLRKEVAE